MESDDQVTSQYVCEDCGVPGVAGFCQLCNGMMILIKEAEEEAAGVYGSLAFDDDDALDPVTDSKPTTVHDDDDF